MLKTIVCSIVKFRLLSLIKIEDRDLRVMHCNKYNHVKIRLAREGESDIDFICRTLAYDIFMSYSRTVWLLFDFFNITFNLSETLCVHKFCILPSNSFRWRLSYVLITYKLARGILAYLAYHFVHVGELPSWNEESRFSFI